MEDEGNTVVFSKKWGSYVENDKTGERIPMVRKGVVYAMVLQAVDNKEKRVKKAKEEDEDVDVDGLSDEGAMRRRATRWFSGGGCCIEKGGRTNREAL